MNKSIYIVIWLLLFSINNLFSQDSGENFIGTYQCTVSNCSLNQLGQFDCEIGTGSKLDFKKTTDLSQIEVVFSDNNHFTLLKENDSTYTYSGTPYISVLFYSNDSVKLSRVHSSVGYSIYRGKKEANSIVVNKKEIKLNPFPNPFDKQIRIDNFQDKNYIILIYNTKGNLIYNSLVNNEYSFSIKTDNIDKGIYFLRIVSSTSMHSYKMVKY